MLWAIREALQTLGRDRGYGTPEYAGPFVMYPAPPPEPEPNFNLLSEPQRARLQELLTIINRETITLEEGRLSTSPAPSCEPPTEATSDEASRFVRFVAPTEAPSRLPDLDEAEVRAVLRKYMGHLGCAADALKLTRSQLRDCIGGAPALQRMLDGFIEDLIDLAEWGLRVAVNNRKRWAICFALRTRGRKMGHGKHPPYEPRWPKPKPSYGLKLLNREEFVELDSLLGKAEGLEEGNK